jgi:hypothetical protein
MQGKAMTTTLASGKLGGINAALQKKSRFKLKVNVVKTLILKGSKRNIIAPFS